MAPRWLYMVMLFLLQLTQLSSQLSTKYLQSKISKSAIYTTKIAQRLLHSVLLHRRQVTHRTERVTHFQLSSGRHMHASRAYFFNNDTGNISH